MLIQLIIVRDTAMLCLLTRGHIRWHARDPILQTLYWSHKAECLDCFSYSGPTLLLRSYPLLGFHTTAMVIDTKLIFIITLTLWLLHGSHDVWQIMRSSAEPELLNIPKDSSPCQDLVIPLDNSQVSPFVTTDCTTVLTSTQFIYHAAVFVSIHRGNSRGAGPVPCYFKSGLLKFITLYSAPCSLRSSSTARLYPQSHRVQERHASTLFPWPGSKALEWTPSDCLNIFSPCAFFILFYSISKLYQPLLQGFRLRLIPDLWTNMRICGDFFFERDNKALL